MTDRRIDQFLGMVLNRPVMAEQPERRGSAVELARSRLEDPGIAASDFRAGIITWRPPAVGFSGQLHLAHRLGRVPDGLLLLRGGLQLAYFVDAGQLAQWTRERVSLWIETIHHSEYGTTVLADGQSTANANLLRGRPDTCTLYTVQGIQDNAASDRPPIKADMSATFNSGGVIVGFPFRLADHSTLSGFSIRINYEVLTDLHPDDEFVWMVI